MSENLGFAMRIKYIKQGRLAFLSHLETIRSMERIIRRAALPYAVTEGFNPHMKVSFGPALPCGAAGLGEYLDLRLREQISCDEALARMKAASVADLAPVACEYIDVHADAVTVAFPLSDWEAHLSGAALKEVQAAFEALGQRGYIEVERKSKKRRGQMEVKRVELEGRLVAGPAFEQQGEYVVVRFSTMAQSQGSSLRPDRYMESAFALMDQDAAVPAVSYLARVGLRSA